MEQYDDNRLRDGYDFAESVLRAGAASGIDSQTARFIVDNIENRESRKRPKGQNPALLHTCTPAPWVGKVDPKTKPFDD
jgi:hypothetical protein